MQLLKKDEKNFFIFLFLMHFLPNRIAFDVKLLLGRECETDLSFSIILDKSILFVGCILFWELLINKNHYVKSKVEEFIYGYPTTPRPEKVRR
jgi:hypothetical protein